ncbi:hypothetical protein ABZT03_33125 [Streptomyces sp. NPDC005574]|uniref:hypothetical protein n=1 Tax=Streptomyces sp. NPDC005574 TaxID=3156891 RepID=UPI0033B34E21
MPPHGSGGRVTSLQRFTAADPGAEPAPGLRAYARHREGLRGFDSGITLRLSGRGGDHVRLEQWSGMDALLRATHDESFLPRLAAVTARAEVRHELAVSVGRMPAAVPLAGAARVVLVRAVVESEPARFEMDFGALVGSCVTAAGYGGSDLLRSVVDPRAYTGVLWWRDRDSCARALATAAYLDRRTKLTSAARVGELHAEPLGDG